MLEDRTEAKRRPDGSIDIEAYLDQAARQRSIAWRTFPWDYPARAARTVLERAIDRLRLRRRSPPTHLPPA